MLPMPLIAPYRAKAIDYSFQAFISFADFHHGRAPTFQSDDSFADGVSGRLHFSDVVLSERMLRGRRTFVRSVWRILPSLAIVRRHRDRRRGRRTFCLC